MNLNFNIKDIKEKILYALSETGRILKLTRKPRRKEYNDVAKTTGMGIILVGLMGFIIFLISQILRELLKPK